MRKLASVQIIKDINLIDGADNISVATVLGWECVVKKGEFNIGDKVIYVEIDSVMPEREEFEFLRARKFKIRTARMKGQISQGIIFPLSILSIVEPDVNLDSLKEDEDLTERLSIIKWDPEQESLVEEKDPVFNDKNKILRFYKKYKYFTIKYTKKALGISTKTSGEKFPSYVPKTDETRVQTMYRGLSMHQGKVAYITEKLEGASTTYIVIKTKGNFFSKLLTKQPMKFIVCSRNKSVNNKIDDRWKIANKYNLENKMFSYKKNFAIQGELIGPKIQNNIYELPERDFRIYLAYDIDEKRYFNYDELVQLSKELQVPLVPVLDDNHVVHTDVKSYVDMSIGNSQLHSKKKREGIVIRLKDENFSFKSINPEYLLSQKD